MAIIHSGKRSCGKYISTHFRACNVTSVHAKHKEAMEIFYRQHEEVKKKIIKHKPVQQQRPYASMKVMERNKFPSELQARVFLTTKSAHREQFAQQYRTNNTA
jgi:hypothetical protein